MPAPSGTINATGFVGQNVLGVLLISNSGGTHQLTVFNCTASAGFSISSPGPLPLVIPARGDSAITLSCAAPDAGVTYAGTLSCDHDAPNVASPVSYNLACNGVSGGIATLGDAGKIMLVTLITGLGLLGVALRRQA